MSTLQSLTAAALNFLALGSGYVYCGRLVRGGLALVLTLALLVATSYVAAFGPWLCGAGVVLQLAVVLFIASDSFRLARHTSARAPWWRVFVYFLAYLLMIAAYFPLRRTAYYVTRGNLMEPTLLSGDHFAVDTKYKDFRAGDLVAFEMDDPSLHVRRLEALQGATAIVTTDSKIHIKSDQIQTSALRGRVIYVTYSLDPESGAPVWSRTLMAVK